jgi:hypothetical protein
MDVVAYRLHMWDWGWVANQQDPLHSEWFGIPYNNYFGWLIVVFTYSYFSRLFEKKMSRNGRQISAEILIPLLSIVISEIILFSFFKYINKILYEEFGITSLYRLLGLLILLVIIVLAGWRRRQRNIPDKLPFTAWIVPAWFHCYFFLWLFIASFDLENKWMTVFAIANFLLAAFIHMPGIFKRNIDPIL